MRGQISELATLTAELEDRLNLIPSAMSEKAQVARRESLAMAKDFDAAVADIDRNTLLSEAGKQEAVAAEGRKLRASLDQWEERYLAPLKERIESLTGRLARSADAPKPTDPVSALMVELRRSELRAKLTNLLPVERDAIYAAADLETAIAMETAPPTLIRTDPNQPAKLMPFVSPQLVAVMRRGRAQEADPEAHAELEAIERVERMYAGTLALVRGALDREVPAEGAPLGEQAVRN